MIVVYRKPLNCHACHISINPGQAFYTPSVTLTKTFHLSCQPAN